jgi:hypothetical protein
MAKKKNLLKTTPEKTSKSSGAAKTGRIKTPAGRPAPTRSKDKPSALDAAARVLGETGKAMSCAELIATMATKGYWTSPAGKTPQATLYAAIQREIRTKKDHARFRKTGPGRFALA